MFLFYAKGTGSKLGYRGRCPQPQSLVFAREDTRPYSNGLKFD